MVAKRIVNHSAQYGQVRAETSGSSLQLCHHRKNSRYLLKKSITSRNDNRHLSFWDSFEYDYLDNNETCLTYVGAM